MRVLFTTYPYLGHFYPLVPLAGAARDAGHEVAFATAAELAPVVERLGFAFLRAGPERPDDTELARLREAAARLPGRERQAFVVRHVFAGATARRTAADLLGVCATWRPDLLVRDQTEFGGCLAAEALGLPHAMHQSTALPAPTFAALGESFAELRAAHGLPPDPDLNMLDRYLVLSPFPSAVGGVAERSWARLHRYRFTPFDRSGDEAAPDWPLPLPGAPLVYATLGTLQNRRTDVLRAFVEALRDEPVNLVVTVGRSGDPDQLGPQPPHVRIERYVPQSLLLPRCDLVVCHGGSGTVLGALAAGLPMVVTPLAADQPDNAERCAAAGVARVLEPADVSPPAVREAVRGVLGDPAYKRAAERVRAEMEALPPLAHVVGLLERLTAERRPIVGSVGDERTRTHVAAGPARSDYTELPPAGAGGSGGEGEVTPP
jgi:UDP:flavonoid glycosyltransferase YjiC (YdhE family)